MAEPVHDGAMNRPHDVMRGQQEPHPPFRRKKSSRTACSPPQKEAAQTKGGPAGQKDFHSGQFFSKLLSTSTRPRRIFKYTSFVRHIILNMLRK